MWMNPLNRKGHKMTSTKLKARHTRRTHALGDERAEMYSSAHRRGKNPNKIVRTEKKNFVPTEIQT
jgi:hypothetical protein